MRIDYDRSCEMYERVQIKKTSNLQEEKIIKNDVQRTFQEEHYFSGDEG
jgi:hypothetical protein